MIRRTAKVVTGTAVAAATVGTAALYADVPAADLDDGTYEQRCRKEGKFPEWLKDFGRAPIFLGATLGSKVYLKHLSSFKADGVEILEEQLESRPPKTGLVTVCNHSATVDDPSVIATMLPWKYMWPSKSRWSVVSQEYGYTYGGIVPTFFYAAKTLPIKRGGGIDQRMLEVLFEKIQAGKWVHIFPEGRIVQEQGLGGRPSPLREEIGRLKWGVGKLIARAEPRPVVVPFYHFNMEKIMPQNEKNEIISFMPRTDISVRVKVGKPINFDDIFAKFEQQRVAGNDPWTTEEDEKALYSAITRRVEEAMMDLERQVVAEEKEVGSPAVVGVEL